MRLHDIILSTPHVLEMINSSLLNKDLVFSDADVITGDMIELSELSTIRNYNSRLQHVAEDLNLPVLDLYKLFAEIEKGEYTTDDGFRVSFEFPDGLFFSPDGIPPSEIGHAIITNELIKVINDYYSESIPEINITKFHKQLNSKNNIDESYIYTTAFL